jgi:cytochrome c oxidase subunit 2
MTRTDRESKPLLVTLALVAALAMYAGLVRGPADEEVLAQVVRDVAFGDTTILHPMAAALVHADERQQVVNVIETSCRLIPHQITLKKGQPVTLSLTSTNRTHRFLLRALKIDTDISPGTTTEVTVTPRVAGRFKAISDHYCRAGHGNMRMTVVVE